MPCDPIKAKDRSRRYRERQKIAKYGKDAAGVDMRGRHKNHASGNRNGRWNHGNIKTTSGYLAVRVPKSHPHAWGPPRLQYAYAYEHVVVATTKLGRDLAPNEVVHHINGDRHDNRPENLEVMTRSEHAAEHSSHPCARGSDGRFVAGAPRHGDPAEWPADLRVRGWPKEAKQ